jgi:hypothetical protein
VDVVYNGSHPEYGYSDVSVILGYDPKFEKQIPDDFSYTTSAIEDVLYSIAKSTTIPDGFAGVWDDGEWRTDLGSCVESEPDRDGGGKYPIRRRVSHHRGVEVSDLYPPPGAVGVYAAATQAGVPVRFMTRCLEDTGYEYVGMWSDGDDYYMPIAGRLPATCVVGPDEILVFSPTSFAILTIENPGDPAATKVFLERENAYIPLEV